MKTAMQELKDKIQHAIEQLNDELNEYKAGYKQCLINIHNAYWDGYIKPYSQEMITEAEQYYKETFKQQEQ